MSEIMSSSGAHEQGDDEVSREKAPPRRPVGRLRRVGDFVYRVVDTPFVGPTGDRDKDDGLRAALIQRYGKKVSPPES